MNTQILTYIQEENYNKAYELWKDHKNTIDFHIGLNICNKLGKIISFIPGGRLGNCLFQYFATKIIALNNDLQYFNYNTIKNLHFKTLSIKSINERYVHNLIKGKVSLNIQPNYVNLIEEYCQIDYVLLHPLTRTLFNPYNEDVILENIKINDLFINIHKNNKVQFHPNDLVLHLRLNDFNFGQLIQPEFIKKLLDKLTWNKFYIVCEKVIYNYELQYLSNFIQYNPIFLQGELFEDMASMFYAPRLICTNSTLAWLMGSLGFNYKSYIPKNIAKISIPEKLPENFPDIHDKIIWHNYHIHQHVKKINPNSENYEVQFQNELYDNSPVSRG
jgi:hypothetical protein